MQQTRKEVMKRESDNPLNQALKSPRATTNHGPPLSARGHKVKSPRQPSGSLTARTSSRSRYGGGSSNESSIRHSPDASTASPRSTWIGHTPIPDPPAPIDKKRLSSWNEAIAAAKAAGQFECVLGVLKDDVHYDCWGYAFTLREGTPLADTLDSWKASARVHLKVMVPLMEPEKFHTHSTDSDKKPAIPQYPRDYYRFGYLIAHWFTPHRDEMRDRLRSHGYDAHNLDSRIPEFEKKIAAAKQAGQLQCCLLCVTAGPDYVHEKEIAEGVFQYALGKQFDILKDWAAAKPIALEVRVPNAPMQMRISSTPCAFGYLMASWEIPVTEK